MKKTISVPTILVIIITMLLLVGAICAITAACIIIAILSGFNLFTVIVAMSALSIGTLWILFNKMELFDSTEIEIK